MADPDADVRLSVVNAIGRLGDFRPIEPLAKLIGKEDLKSQMAVGVALMRLNDPRGLEGITKCLGDPNSKMREDAAVELLNSWFRSEMLVNPLVEHLPIKSPRANVGHRNTGEHRKSTSR